LKLVLSSFNSSIGRDSNRLICKESINIITQTFEITSQFYQNEFIDNDNGREEFHLKKFVESIIIVFEMVRYTAFLIERGKNISPWKYCRYLIVTNVKLPGALTSIHLEVQGLEVDNLNQLLPKKSTFRE
jgi:hypothetical protein